MSSGRRRWNPEPGWILVAQCLLVALPGCTDQVNQANFDRVQVGMSQAEVEAILGPPTQNYQGILTWNAGNRRYINVVLDDRKLVAEKDSEGL